MVDLYPANEIPIDSSYPVSHRCLCSCAPSRIELDSVHSTVLGVQRFFNVFLPENYDQGNEHYPVVYLFRGQQDEWANPNADGSRRGNIKTVVDSLYAAGKVGRIILLMPGLSPPTTDPEFEYVFSELIPYTDSHFRTIPTRWKRGMDGFSLGGLTAAFLLWHRPDIFSTAGAYDGSFWGFDMNSFMNAPDTYWAVLRPMKFLLHAAVVGPNNFVYVQQFADILAAHGIQNSFLPLALDAEASHSWYFADVHMAYSLPIHWEKFRSTQRQIEVQMQGNPFAGKVSGIIPFEWTTVPGDTSLEVIAEHSRDDGKSWKTIERFQPGTRQFSWNTATVPDGTRNRLRLWCLNDSLYGLWETPASFVIDNPGDGAPDIVILSPTRNQSVSGVFNVMWSAGDAENDPLVLSIFATHDNGREWEQIASALTNSGSFQWDSRAAPNSQSTRLRIRCSDGTLFSEDTSRLFQVSNQRMVIQSSYVLHVAGRATPYLSVNVTNPDALTGHKYRITFDDTSTEYKTYSVIDLESSELVVQHAVELDGHTEGPLFDGIRLVIGDYAQPGVNEDSSRWTRGSSNLNGQVTLPEFTFNGELLRGTPYPADYRITIFNHIVDTSEAWYGADAVPMFFNVWNTTDNHQVKVVFSDGDHDQKLSMLDFIILFESDGGGRPLMTWQLFMESVVMPVSPLAGDVFEIRINKPLTSSDVFEFIPMLTGSELQAERSIPDGFSLMQNFPNPFNPTTKIRYALPVYSKATLKVFTILGQEFSTLVNQEMKAGNYEITFDARGMSSGVYFYVLKAGDFVQIRKLLLLR